MSKTSKKTIPKELLNAFCRVKKYPQLQVRDFFSCKAETFA